MSRYTLEKIQKRVDSERNTPAGTRGKSFDVRRGSMSEIGGRD